MPGKSHGPFALVAALALAPLGPGLVAQVRWIRQTTVGPSARIEPAIATYQQEAVLFGGGDSNGPLGDTWVWDGATWNNPMPSSRPPARNAGGMVFDVARQRCLLFGGQAVPSRYQDLWAWDGSTWTQITILGVTPTGRNSFGMAYDRRRDRIVLFGGETTTGINNQTWEFDPGSLQWTLRSPPAAPSRRCCLGLVYDEKREQCVLFGGRDLNNNISFDDTWIWDGATWRQLPPGPRPVARDRMQMAYDTARERIVLFGGSNAPSGTVYDDTWEWDGTTWEQRLPLAGPPPARLAGASCFVPAGTSPMPYVLLFGGVIPADTWIYAPQFPAKVALVGPGCPASMATPTLSVVGLPWIGDTIILRLAAAPPFAPTVLVLDIPPPLALYLPLWCSTACLLRVNTTLMLPLGALAGGNYDVPLALPRNPAPAGTDVLAQIGVWSSQSSCLGFTNALQLTIGAR